MKMLAVFRKGVIGRLWAFVGNRAILGPHFVKKAYSLSRELPASLLQHHQAAWVRFELCQERLSRVSPSRVFKFGTFNDLKVESRIETVTTTYALGGTVTPVLPLNGQQDPK